MELYVALAALVRRFECVGEVGGSKEMRQREFFVGILEVSLMQVLGIGRDFMLIESF